MPGKPRPSSRIGRKRRTLGWTILIFGVIVAGVWVAGRWWSAEWRLGKNCIFTRWGVVGCESSTSRLARYGTELRANPEPGWWMWCGWGDLEDEVRRTYSRGFYWKQEIYVFSSRLTTFASIVLWPIPLLLLPPAALLLRSGIVARRRAMTGKCKVCGYDLAGLGECAKCPECGKA